MVLKSGKCGSQKSKGRAMEGCLLIFCWVREDGQRGSHTPLLLRPPFRSLVTQATRLAAEMYQALDTHDLSKPLKQVDVGAVIFKVKE